VATEPVLAGGTEVLVELGGALVVLGVEVVLGIVLVGVDDVVGMLDGGADVVVDVCVVDVGSGSKIPLA